MHRIDQPTAVSTLPTPAAAGTPGYFTGGNPATGSPATVLDADWANNIQEELISILIAASVSPSKTANNQVLIALQDIFLQKSNNLSDLGSLSTALTNLGFSQSAGSSGYVKLPGGIIIQWADVAIPTGNGDVVTLPTTFPNNLWHINATDYGSGPHVMGLVHN